MKKWRYLVLTAAILLTPVASVAKPVLSAGEFSVGAEFFPFNGLNTFRTGLDVDRVPQVSPSVGFNFRYAFSQQFAAYGDLAFFHRVQEGPDFDTFYAIGAGVQFDFVSTRHASALFRGGLQFHPRIDDDLDQDFGVRFYMGPGVEARVSEALSLQIYSPLIDLGIGGWSTTLDFNLMPSLAMFVYF